MSTSAGLGVAEPTTDDAATHADLKSQALNDTSVGFDALDRTDLVRRPELREFDAAGDGPPARFAPEPPGLLGAWAHLARNTTPLLATDAAVVTVVAVLASAVTRLAFGPSAASGWLSPEIAAAVPALLLTFTAMGLYPGIGMGPVVELRRTWVATTLTAGLLLVSLAGVTAEPLRFAASLGLVWFGLLATLPIARSLVRRRLSRSSWWGEGVVVLGGGPRGSHLLDRLQENEESGLRPIGVIDSYHRHWDSADPAESRWYLGPPETVAPLLRAQRVRWAVVTDEFESRTVNGHSPDAWSDCLASVPNRLVLAGDALPSLWTQSRECGGVPALHLGERLLCPTARVGKRSIDLGVCLAGGLVVGPLIAVLAVLVKLTSKGPIFYAQRRVGMNGDEISVWKFRSMVVNAEQVLQRHLDESPELRDEWDRYRKLKRDPRVTAIGRFLRKTSLDEIPQLWNVIRGDMSLVGPRPLPCGDESLYGDRLPLYLRVRPGITGLWQVSGRNNTTYQVRVDCDSYYARNWSPWLDLHILMRTFRTVLFCEGAY